VNHLYINKIYLVDFCYIITEDEQRLGSWSTGKDAAKISHTCVQYLPVMNLISVVGVI
jgi:hypothetical protein